MQRKINNLADAYKQFVSKSENEKIPSTYDDLQKEFNKLNRAIQSQVQNSALEKYSDARDARVETFPTSADFKMAAFLFFLEWMYIAVSHLYKNMQDQKKENNEIADSPIPEYQIMMIAYYFLASFYLSNFASNTNNEKTAFDSGCAIVFASVIVYFGNVLAATLINKGINFVEDNRKFFEDINDLESIYANNSNTEDVEQFAELCKLIDDFDLFVEKNCDQQAQVSLAQKFHSRFFYQALKLEENKKWERLEREDLEPEGMEREQSTIKHRK